MKIKSINDARLAKEIGVTQPTLNIWRSREKLTPTQIMAIIDRFEKNDERRTIADSITPIIEFFYLDRIESKQGANWDLSAFLTYLQKSFPEGSPEELVAFL